MGRIPVLKIALCIVGVYILVCYCLLLFINDIRNGSDIKLKQHGETLHGLPPSDIEYDSDKGDKEPIEQNFERNTKPPIKPNKPDQIKKDKVDKIKAKLKEEVGLAFISKSLQGRPTLIKVAFARDEELNPFEKRNKREQTSTYPGNEMRKKEQVRSDQMDNNSNDQLKRQTKGNESVFTLESVEKQLETFSGSHCPKGLEWPVIAFHPSANTDHLNANDYNKNNSEQHKPNSFLAKRIGRRRDILKDSNSDTKDSNSNTKDSNSNTKNSNSNTKDSNSNTKNSNSDTKDSNTNNQSNTSSNNTLQRDCVEPNFSSIPLPRTALASFPGCGNTWTRHLIQQLTGVWTGSMYNDASLRPVFRGEEHHDQSVVVIKTHYPFYTKSVKKQRVEESYKRAILVLRSPQDCILAEFHRGNSHGHHGLAPVSLFNSTQWAQYVPYAAKSWFSFYERWLQKECVLVVDFQRLKTDLQRELRQMATFLGVRGKFVEDNIKCIVGQPEGKFKRKKKKSSLDVYSESQRLLIERFSKHLADLMEKKANFRPVFDWP